jgi:hypothetical protein
MDHWCTSSLQEAASLKKYSKGKADIGRRQLMPGTGEVPKGHHAFWSCGVMVYSFYQSA